MLPQLCYICLSNIISCLFFSPFLMLLRDRLLYDWSWHDNSFVLVLFMLFLHYSAFLVVLFLSHLKTLASVFSSVGRYSFSVTAPLLVVTQRALSPCLGILVLTKHLYFLFLPRGDKS